MPTEEAVSAKITAKFPSLSRKQKSIARFVMDNEYFVAFASAAEVGGSVNQLVSMVILTYRKPSDRSSRALQPQFRD
jgi:DNA-binding MurR/RpiR family transcriptional regulator